MANETCDATACGFTCDRDKDHGAIHHHPESSTQLGHDHYWVSFPHGQKEWNGLGIPWTGYLLVGDSALPMSSVEQTFDHRLIELFIESFTKGR